MNALTKLSAETVEALAQQALERQPVVSLALKANPKRREGKNDAHLTGYAFLSTMKAAQLIAEALEQGKTEIGIFVDIWDNGPDSKKSRYTGRGNTVVVAKDTANDE